MDDDQEERARQYRHISNQLEGAKRPHRDANLMASRIIRLAEVDVEGWCPNNYEQIMAYMDEADKILEFLVSYLRDLLNKAIKVNFYSEGLEDVLYDTEGLRERLMNLRLSLITWAKKFEGPERPLPTPEEEADAEAEMVETYRRCGVELPPGAARAKTGQAEGTENSQA